MNMRPNSDKQKTGGNFRAPPEMRKWQNYMHCKVKKINALFGLQMGFKKNGQVTNLKIYPIS